MRPRTNIRSVVNIAKTTDPAVIDTIDIGRGGEKEYIPPWVADFAGPDNPQPPKPVAGMQTVTVGRSGDTPSKYADINSALEALPAAGGVIQLVGEGPFDLHAVQITEGRKLIIVGEPDLRPVVVLQPDPDKPQRPVVTLEDASLTLLNLQLAAVSSRFAQEGTATFFDVRDSGLAVRRCSVTLLGQRAGPTAAFSTSRWAKAESGVGNARLLIDRTFVRGEGLTALAIGGTACDLVAWNCLFASGVAPFVHVSGSVPRHTNPSRRTQAAAASTRFEVHLLHRRRHKNGIRVCGGTRHGRTPPHRPPDTQLTFFNAPAGTESHLRLTGRLAPPGSARCGRIRFCQPLVESPLIGVHRVDGVSAARRRYGVETHKHSAMAKRLESYCRKGRAPNEHALEARHVPPGARGRSPLDPAPAPWPVGIS